MRELSVGVLGLLRYSWMGPCHWMATVLSYLVVPCIVPFANETGWLPKWLYWFQTLDNSLDGDMGWQREHRPWLETPYIELTSFQRYISRVLWLYRNPVYGFEKTILCAKLDPGTLRYINGSEGLGSRWSDPPYKVGCCFYSFRTSESRSYVEFTWFLKVSTDLSFNGMIGWKLNQAGFPREDTYNAQICTTLRFTKLIKD